MVEVSPVKRTALALGAELVSAGVWAMIDAQSLAANAPWVAGVGILTLVVVWFWDQIQEFRNWKNETKSRQPRLQASAKLMKGTRKLRIKFVNIGDEDVQLLSYKIDCGDSSDVVPDADGKLLPPGGALTLKRSMVWGDKKFVYVRLAIDLRLPSTGSYFTGHYSFDLEGKERAEANAWSVEPGLTVATKNAAFIENAFLRTETSSIITVLLKERAPGVPNDFTINSGGKEFSFVPSSGFVKFEGLCKNQRKCLVAELPENTSKTHVITLAWGPDVLKLQVNDNAPAGEAIVTDLGTRYVQGF